MNIELYLVFVHYEGDRERIHHFLHKDLYKIYKTKITLQNKEKKNINRLSLIRPNKICNL